MPYAKCLAVVLMATAIAAAAPAPPAGPVPATPTAEAPPDELEQAFKQAPLVLEFQVETVEANPTADPRLVWEVRAALLGVHKGRLLPGRFSIHVDSVVRAFDKPRAEVGGNQFVAPLQPLGQAVKRRFQIVGGRAYPVGSAEADRLRELSETSLPAGEGGEGLRLVVEPIEKVFPVDGPKVVEVRLVNESEASATYVQRPIAEKAARLFLPGTGAIRLKGTTGRPVRDKGNVLTGIAPPPPPQPAIILPGAELVETVDLEKYYSLPAGRYTFSMFLATPDGRGRIPSNGFSFQVGAVNLPDEPTPTPPEPKPAEVPARPGPRLGPPVPDEATNTPAEAPDAKLPDPHSYQTGAVSFGLAGLLRPTQAVYTLGEPVNVELRLINTGPKTVAIDTRLERTLTVQVEPVDDSPQPLMIRQVIPWPNDEQPLPSERAYLRERAFWGRTLNLNTLDGQSLDTVEAPTPAEIAESKSLRYERFGRDLFGFTKPGTYTVKARYFVSRLKQPGKDENGDPGKLWWTGDVETNSITIRVAEKK